MSSSNPSGRLGIIRTPIGSERKANGVQSQHGGSTFALPQGDLTVNFESFNQLLPRESKVISSRGRASPRTEGDEEILREQVKLKQSEDYRDYLSKEKEKRENEVNHGAGLTDENSITTAHVERTSFRQRRNREGKAKKHSKEEVELQRQKRSLV
uniref:BZIP domain-containing protein n=1 Tax=Caenorhabditis tropicalis TaxID=1561998 RepID=A0A1I7T358_9PELO